MDYDVIILGAGAAGMFCAIEAARQQIRSGQPRRAARGFFEASKLTDDREVQGRLMYMAARSIEEADAFSERAIDLYQRALDFNPALARALYQAPPLLLLDDVLSAVDQGTETRLVAAIRGLREQDAGSTPTTVIVSHRTSVLEHADEILVLDQGQVVERGTHAELVALGGHYAEAHVHQRTEDSDV